MGNWGVHCRIGSLESAIDFMYKDNQVYGHKDGIKRASVSIFLLVIL